MNYLNREGVLQKYMLALVLKALIFLKLILYLFYVNDSYQKQGKNQNKPNPSISLKDHTVFGRWSFMFGADRELLLQSKGRNRNKALRPLRSPPRNVLTVLWQGVFWPRGLLTACVRKLQTGTQCSFKTFKTKASSLQSCWVWRSLVYIIHGLEILLALTADQTSHYTPLTDKAI